MYDCCYPRVNVISTRSSVKIRKGTDLQSNTCRFEHYSWSSHCSEGRILWQYVSFSILYLYRKQGILWKALNLERP